jgi:hypothetical protein
MFNNILNIIARAVHGLMTSLMNGNDIGDQLYMLAKTPSSTITMSYAWLCMYRVRRFHRIMLVVEFHTSRVLIMDSLNMDPKLWVNMRNMLQK